MSINRVVISGNLTRDPELKALPSGTSVLALGIAVNDRRKNQESGQWEDVPNFFDVSIFGARADALSRFLSKGSKVAIEGRLRWHQWETPQGDKRSKVDIVADEIEFLSSRDGGSGPSYSAPEPAAIDVGGDEIPF
jgi:single-strand DNA-binding protein